MDLRGNNYVVTGANAGIGYAVTQQLLVGGATVIMACRNLTKAHAAIAELQVYAHAIHVVQLDLADFTSVHQGADKILNLLGPKPLHGLVNNAGVYTRSPPKGEQVEYHMQVNHMGHFALTQLLYGKLCASCAKVVHVSSAASKIGVLNWRNSDDLYKLTTFRRYATSKLANLLFHQELQRRMIDRGDEVTSTVCHPGAVHTKLSGEVLPGLTRLLSGVMGLILLSTEQGAAPVVTGLCTATEADRFYGPNGSPLLSRRVQNVEAAQALWRNPVPATGFDQI